MRPWSRLVALASFPTLLLATAGPASATDQQTKQRIAFMLFSQLRACWSPPPPRTPAEAVVRVHFELDRDGALTKGPDVIEGPDRKPTPATVEAAKRAVRRCLPIKLPPEDYEYWRETFINFDARSLIQKPAAPASPQ